VRRRGLIAAAAILATTRAGAQARPTIGFLNADSAAASTALVEAFKQGLADAGFAEGSVVIDYRWAEGQYDRLPALAAELVGRKVDVIVTSGGGRLAPLAAKAATSTIPIVFGTGSDPVADGMVASFARPGGNLTGVAFLVVELNPKRLQLISEITRERRIGLLSNPDSASHERILREMHEAARMHGLQLHVVGARNAEEIDSAFASFAAEKIGALVVSSDAAFNGHRHQIAALAARHAMPAIYSWREFTTAGGLMAYGPNRVAVYRQLGVYSGRILRGAKPAELPVLQPTAFELVVNVKAARALGIEASKALLQRADELIE
jgi:putative ABC transport system substrate-binding protein